MTLTKKQVKALLEVLSKDDSRPVLEHALIDNYNNNLTLVATDSYKLVALTIAPLDDDNRVFVGQLVSRKDLERWYKLASGRDFLFNQEIFEMAAPDSDLSFPHWQNSIKQLTDLDSDLQVATPLSSKLTFSLDGNFICTLENLAAEPLSFTLTSSLSPWIATTSEGLYLLMPRISKTN